jgi:hypothetical protein
MIQQHARNALTNKVLSTKIINVLHVLLLIKSAKPVMEKTSALLASIKESLFSRVSAPNAHHLTKTALNVR